MTRYKYHLIVNKDYKEGIVKAFNYSDAKNKIIKQFRWGKIRSLDVKECENCVKTMISGFLQSLMQILIKLIPVAVGILIIYLALKYLL